MTDRQRDALATICLAAAFADGRKDDAERARLQGIFDDLGAAFSPALYQRVLLGQTDLAEESAALGSDPLRALAYEMAVGVCDADGVADPAETAFLADLRVALGLDAEAARQTDATGAAFAAVPLAAQLPAEAAPQWQPVQQTPAQDAPPSAPVAQPAAQSADVRSMVLKYAVLNGGLELLPQSLATMAVLPMQMKMVYRVGKHFGYELDRGHIKELLGVVGVGMTSQVVETYARKLVGGAAGGLLGGLAGGAFGKKGKKKTKKFAKKAAGAATGAAMSFGTTYALGRMAEAYYAGGRTFSAERLRGLYDDGLVESRALYQQHLPQIQQSAQTTDLSSLLTQVKSFR